MRSDFSKIKRKIFSKMIFATVLTAIAGFLIMLLLIDGAFQKPFADFFIAGCRYLLRMSREEAIHFYRNIFWNHKQLFMAIGFVIMLLIFLYFTMSKFTKYFDQISRGIDTLLDESEPPVRLKPELKFMEDTLNTVKMTLKKRREDAEKSEQRKNDLVVYLAHDIKTPLTSVIGYLTLLSESPDMPTEQKAKYTHIALDKAQRLESLINEFFEITRFNSQTITLEKEELNLSLLLEQVSDELYPLLESKEVKAVLHIENAIYIIADPDKLARVFNNLLKNAITYSHAHTEISIFLTRHGSYVQTVFENHGQQIPEDQLETIFEKFYRLDSARSSLKGGAGLGLAIAKEIVELHKGVIRAESTSDYTRFIVLLPA